MSMRRKIRDWIDGLFGYDVFISYRRRESREYATALRDALQSSQPPLRTFLDTQDFVPGDSLDDATHRDLKRSRLLAVVVTRTALGSPHIRKEIEIFENGDALVVPIDVGEHLVTWEASDEIANALRKRIFLSEPANALERGPSAEIVQKLRSACRFTRSTQRRLTFFAIAAGLFLLIALAAVYAAVMANNARLEAERRQRVTQAQALASRALQLREGRPQEASLLAVEAALQTQKFGQPVVPLAEQAMRQLADIPPVRGFALHSAPLVALELSADGTTIATGGYDGVTQMVQLRENGLEHAGVRIPIFRQSVYSLAIHPAGDWLAVGGGRGAYVYRIAPGSATRADVHSRRNMTGAVQFDPSGRWLAAVTSTGAVQLWPVTAAGPDPRALELHTGKSSASGVAVAFSTTGILVAALGEHGCLAWDVREAEPKQLPLDCGVGGAYTARFNADGRLLAIGARTLRVYETDDSLSLSLLAEAQTHDEVRHLRWSPDSRWIATAYGATPTLDVGGGRVNVQVELWDTRAAPGRLTKHPLQANPSYATAVSFDPTSQWLATGDESGSIALWQLGAGRPVRVQSFRACDEAIRTLAFAPDTSLLVGDAHGALKRWELADLTANPLTKRTLGSERLISQVFNSSQYAIDLQRRWLAAGLSHFPDAEGTGTLEVWDLGSGRRQSLRIMEQKGHIYGLGFSHDSSKLVTASGDGLVRFWSTATFRRAANPDQIVPERVVQAQGSTSPSLGLGRETSHILFAEKGALRVIDFDDPAFEVRIPLDPKEIVFRLSLSDDGEWFSALMASGVITYGRVTDGKLHHVRLEDLSEEWKQPDRPTALSNVLFVRRAPTLALVPISGPIGLLSLREQGNPQIAIVPTPPLVHIEESERAVAFSEDGRWMMASTLDGVVQRIDLRSPTQPQQLRWRETGVSAIAMDSDGSTVVIGGKDGVLRVWRDSDFSVEPVELRGQPLEVSSVQFTPDGWVLSVQRGLLPTFWPLSLSALTERVCASAMRNLTLVEWHQHFGNEPFSRTCHNAPIDRSVFFDALTQVSEKIDAGDIREAKQLMRALVTMAEAGDTSINAGVCWYAALFGWPELAAPACKRTSADADSDAQASYADSRAVALAMLGESDRAAEELRIHLRWREAELDDDQLASARRDWLRALEHGRNPFTAELRQSLLASQRENAEKAATFDVLR